jgi:hypothetical protein
MEGMKTSRRRLKSDKRWVYVGHIATGSERGTGIAFRVAESITLKFDLQKIALLSRR